MKTRIVEGGIRRAGTPAAGGQRETRQREKSSSKGMSRGGLYSAPPRISPNGREPGRTMLANVGRFESSVAGSGRRQLPQPRRRMRSKPEEAAPPPAGYAFLKPSRPCSSRRGRPHGAGGELSPRARPRNNVLIGPRALAGGGGKGRPLGHCRGPWKEGTQSQGYQHDAHARRALPHRIAAAPTPPMR